MQMTNCKFDQSCHGPPENWRRKIGYLPETLENMLIGTTFGSLSFWDNIGIDASSMRSKNEHS